MQPEPKKHVSHAIAWSLIALLTGSLAFGIWTYFSQISDIYDSSVTISFSHKKTATTKPTTATTGTTATDATAATADWKTYTNTDYEYSVKYPADWTVDLTSKDSSGKAIAIFLAPETSNTPHAKMIDIQVSPTTSVSKVGSSDYLTNNNNINPVTSQSSITVDGIKTTKLIADLNNGYDIITYVDKSPNTYTISLVNTKSTDTDYIDTLNNILSTFTFTK